MSRAIQFKCGCQFQYQDCNIIPEDCDLAFCSTHEAAPELYAAVKMFLDHLESGVLVRDITKDGTEEWAPNMLRLVFDLQKAQDAVLKAEGKS